MKFLLTLLLLVCGSINASERSLNLHLLDLTDKAKTDSKFWMDW